MQFSLTSILLGATLAAASPIAHNNTLVDRSTKPFPANSTNGHTPTNSTGVAKFLAGIEKCDVDGYQECQSSGDKDCDEVLSNGGKCTIQDFLRDLLKPRPEIPDGATLYGGGKYFGGDKVEPADEVEPTDP